MFYTDQQPMASQYDPKLIKEIRKEIMNDLKARREWQEKYYGQMEENSEWNPEYPPRPGYGMGYGRRCLYPRYGMGMGPGRYYGWCPYPTPRPKYDNQRPPEVDFDWWIDREEYDYQRNRSMLRKQLLRELRAMNNINQRIGQVRDPHIGQMLYELIQEANQQGMNVSDIKQSLDMNNESGYSGALWNRITEPLRGVERRSFGWGAGATLISLLLVPSLSKTLRPMARKAMEEAMEITERAQGFVARAKEEIEDIVAEASFNKIKNSVANQAGMMGKEPSK